MQCQPKGSPGVILPAAILAWAMIIDLALGAWHLIHACR